jgi:hypothetical protein
VTAALEVLAEIRRRGVTLSVRDGRLIARPIDLLPPDLAECARPNRAEIIDLPARKPEPETERVATLDREWRERDRLLNSAYDYDPSIHVHGEYLDGINHDGERATSPAKSLIRTCREYGVGLRLDPDGAVVAESNGRAWRSLMRAIEAHADGVVRVIEAGWDSNDA